MFDVLMEVQNSSIPNAKPSSGFDSTEIEVYQYTLHCNR